LRVAERYPGLRPGRQASLYEALVDSIVKQRVALKAALRLESRLVRAYGVSVGVGGRAFHSPPEPLRLAGASVDELRGLGLSRVKAEALREVARAELEGRLPSVREVESSGDPWEVAAELTRLRGVGPWTAELAVAQVHPLFPVGPRGDLAVRRGLRILLGVTGEAVDVIVRELGEYAGLAMYIAALHYERSLKHRRRHRRSRGG